MSKMNLKEYLEKRNDYFDENIKMTNEGKKYGDWILKKALMENDPNKKYVIISACDFICAVEATQNKTWINQARNIVERFIRGL